MPRAGLLGGVLVLWAAVVWWQFAMPPEPQRVPLTNVSGSSGARATVPPSPEWAVMKTVRTSGESPFTPKRNLFAPLTEQQEQWLEREAKRRKQANAKAEVQHTPEVPPAPITSPEPRPATPPTPGPSPEELAAQAARAEREQKIRKVQEQFGAYRLLGLAEREGTKQAFVGKGNDIHVVRQGDQLDGLFLVTLIDARGVKLREREFNLEHTITLKQEGSGPS